MYISQMGKGILKAGASVTEIRHFSPSSLAVSRFKASHICFLYVVCSAAGRVCAAGTNTDKAPKCPPGFYSEATGLTNASECLPCTVGHAAITRSFELEKRLLAAIKAP